MIFSETPKISLKLYETLDISGYHPNQSPAGLARKVFLLVLKDRKLG
jgi:hypothetical protein